MGEIKTLGYYVNGEWKKSAAEHYTDAFDPSTGKVIAKVPCCTSDEVEEAMPMGTGIPTFTPTIPPSV